MAKNRLALFLIKTSRLYVIVASGVFCVWQVLVWLSYAYDGTQKDYCIYGLDNICHINWMFFVNEPLFLSALAYLVLIGPVAVLGFAIKKIHKNM